tara:strand:- start:2292 stop:2498 length:207 start_codon:yes stop_codon:yes gene_type:complete
MVTLVSCDAGITFLSHENPQQAILVHLLLNKNTKTPVQQLPKIPVKVSIKALFSLTNSLKLHILYYII